MAGRRASKKKPDEWFTRELIQHIARLAGLNLSVKELPIYTSQLGEIVGYVEQLGEVKTHRVRPTYQVLDGLSNVWREDVVEPSLPTELALAAVPKTYGGYVVTAGVFEDKKGGENKRLEVSKEKRRRLDSYNAALTQADVSGSVGHKDMFLTRGVETTAGSRVLEGYVPPYSATVVERLEKAGFNTKFKLNQDAWAHGSSGENSDFGNTLNPWDKSKTPGGSCSGSAAAVAGGLVDWATGTDTGGSIRLPASFTNTTSLKPTYGALSRWGVVAMASSLDCPGAIAWSAAEVGKLFRIMTGEDSRDATSRSPARIKARLKPVNSLKIGLPKEFFGEGVDKQVKNLVMKAVGELQGRGAKVIKLSLPHTRYGIPVYYMIQATEVASNLARYDGVRYGYDRRYFGAEAKRRIMLGTFASSAGYTSRYYERAARVRTLIARDFSRAFKRVDVLVAPVSPTPPFNLGEKVDDPLKMYLADVLTVTISLAGLPSLALPCCFSSLGMPVGMQLVGPRWSEEMLLALGEGYQKVTDWHKRRPDGEN